MKLHASPVVSRSGLAVKLAYAWLKEFVPDLPPVGETAERLSAGGLGVASVRPYTSAYEGVVVGEVLRADKHPNADRLSLCLVEAGGETFEVVCGAPNARPGLKAPFARLGARLPGGREIKPAKIRGVTSQGMLCSAAELGAGQDADGLLELPASAVAGEAYAHEPEDWILDVEVTPNRGDCLSVLGVARQIAAVLGVPRRAPAGKAAPRPGGAGDPPAVRLEDPEGCGLYTARILAGIKVGPSPEWMRRRLEAGGIRPINNVVDITNYVLLELGQPLHAFDLGRLPGREIGVRRSREGETLRTLDGVDRKLPAGVLLVTSGGRPAAAAGIMGGAGSEISGSTTEVLLESAWFAPAVVRRGSKALGLASESSYRFERGVDPAGVVPASDRAAALLAELAGASAATETALAEGRLPSPGPIEVDPAEVSGVLGVGFQSATLAGYAQRLGASWREAGGGRLEVTPPSWRLDLREPADLTEEFATLYGYERVPATLPALEAGSASRNVPALVAESVRGSLRAAGFSEAQTSSFASREDAERLAGTAPVPVDNPLNEEQGFLRASLLPGLLRSAAYNLAREAPGVRLMEIGRVFRAEQAAGVAERRRAALVASGRLAQDVHEPERRMDFFDVKGAIESVAASLGVELAFEPGAAEPYVRDRSARLLAGGVQVGAAGVLRREVAAAYEVPEETVAAEVDLEALAARAALTAAVKPPTRFPAVRRDLAVVVPVAATAAALASTMLKAGRPMLETASVFDEYRGRQLPEGRKSLAFRLVFRSPERTLTEQEVADTVDRVVTALKERFQAVLRS